ncbi:MAG: SpoIIE family protein phosphatase [Acidobacteria bacterium]|nr:SpoIIE family protein phosphatase [Acidobacteriota bacterium]
MRAQLELKDRALASSAEGITITDARLPDNPLIYANAGFERLTGYSAAEVIGRNCRFLQGPGTDPEAVAVLRTAIQNRRAVTVTLLNYRKDGAPFWNRLSITPVRDAAGAVTHFIGVQSDVTEEKQAKDALQRANARLETANRVMKRDLEAAAEVQRALLPGEMPLVPGMRLAYTFRPCGDVGGDSLNVLPLDGRHLGVYILDVSGHGVAAALLSVTLSHMLSVEPGRSFLYQICPDDPGQYCIAPPVTVVTRLNRHFAKATVVSKFFTMIYGILDKETAEFRYVSAGHLSPAHFRCGVARPIQEAGGIPLGLLPEAAYEENNISLSKGDRLYLFTDGILEAESPSEEAFGVDRMLEILTRSHALRLEETVSSLMQRIDEWTAPAAPADDASLLAIERTA